jgi:hypothetical protein
MAQARVIEQPAGAVGFSSRISRYHCAAVDLAFSKL